VRHFPLPARSSVRFLAAENSSVENFGREVADVVGDGRR
jgi:hypothetical protein